MDSKDKIANTVTSKSQTKLRWVVLMMVNIILFSDYYCYDNPAALKTQIGDRMGNPANYETLFSLFYTLYSFPNIVLPFFSGYFVDTYGVFVCMLAFTIFEITGQAIFATGLMIRSWPMMMIGRLIYGFGGGSLSVGVSAIISVWFSGKELAFAFGINTAMARLGSVTNNLASPSIASDDGVVVALWVGVFLLALNLICVFMTRIIDRKVEKSLGHNVFVPLLTEDEEEDDSGKAKKGHASPSTQSLLHHSKTEMDDDDSNVILKLKVANDDSGEPIREKPSLWNVRKFSYVFWVITLVVLLVYGCISPFNNILSSLLLERDYFKAVSASCQLTDSSVCQSESNTPQSCPSSQWYQPPLPDTVNVADIDCSKTSYQDSCDTSVYCDRLSDGELKAATVMSIPYIISTCLIPLVGAFVDTFGLRGVIVALSPAILVVVHTVLGATSVSPIGPLVGQGVAYSLFAGSVWPSIPLVMDERYIGLAYGTVFAVLNIGYAVLPLIIAQIYSNSGDTYIPNVEYFIAGLAAAALMVALYLNYYDFTHLRSVLNKPQAESKERSNSIATR